MSNFIVWELISPCDGFHQVEVDTWDEASQLVEKLVRESQFSNFLKPLFNKWKKGNLDKIYYNDEKLFSNVVEIFVTSKRLTINDQKR